MNLFPFYHFIFFRYEFILVRPIYDQFQKEFHLITINSSVIFSCFDTFCGMIVWPTTNDLELALVRFGAGIFGEIANIAVQFMHVAEFIQ